MARTTARPANIISKGPDTRERDKTRQANEQMVNRKEMPRRWETLSMNCSGLREMADFTAVGNDISAQRPQRRVTGSN